MKNSICIQEDTNIEVMLAYAAKAGFKEVLLGFGSSKLFFDDAYQDYIGKIKDMLDKYGLTCGQTHLPYYHLTVSSNIIQPEMELAITRCIQASADLGAQWTTYHPRTAVNQGYNRTSSFADNKVALSRYVEVGEKYGVGITVENMPLYPNSAPHWRFFGGGWEELCELCDSIDSDKIGICWDFGHAHTAALDQGIAIRDVGSRLKMTHVHDNYKNGDHHQLPALGDLMWGCIDWEKPMHALKDIHYEGSLALELIYPPLPMCESFVKLAFDTLNYLKTL